MRKLTKAEKAKRSKSIGVINGTYAKMKAARAKRSKSIGVLNGEMHKDVKSHNTKINVFSGTKNFVDYKVYKNHIIDIEVNNGKKTFIAHGGYIHVPFYCSSLAVAKKFIDRVVKLHKLKNIK